MTNRNVTISIPTDLEPTIDQIRKDFGSLSAAVRFLLETYAENSHAKTHLTDRLKRRALHNAQLQVKELTRQIHDHERELEADQAATEHTRPLELYDNGPTRHEREQARNEQARKHQALANTLAAKHGTQALERLTHLEQQLEEARTDPNTTTEQYARLRTEQDTIERQHPHWKRLAQHVGTYNETLRLTTSTVTQ